MAGGPSFRSVLSPELAATTSPSNPSRAAALPRHPAGLALGARSRRALAAIAQRWDSVPARSRLVGIAVVGATAAAAVGYTTSRNPSASPQGDAVTLRVAIIVALLGAGLYVQTSRIQTRLGGLLIGAGLLSSLWLLNGSDNRLLFSIGVVCGGVMPVTMAYLMLVQPTGRLLSRTEQRFLWLTGGTLAMLWLLGVVMTSQPPLRTPLLQCAPHCPSSVFSLASAPTLVDLVKVTMKVAWSALAIGTPLLLARRARASSAPVRRSLKPVSLVAWTSAGLLVAYFVSVTAGLGPTPLAGLYVATGVAVAPAILVGLSQERALMGQALAEFVTQLARLPKADPEALMATALRDPSLRIAYCRPTLGSYVDSFGLPMPQLPGDRAVAWIDRDDRPVAAVMYNPELSGFERFVQAAGAAAVIRLEKAQLEAELRASNADLAASRVRLIETAHAERRRLERDLHDGVQQHLVGLRIKLELAAQEIRDDPGTSEHLLASVGRQLDGVLTEVRSLARGIYPALLTEHGLGEALRAAARNSPLDVEVHARRIGRYPEDVEVAVYFCCLEALQNAAKHAGSDVPVTVSLWLEAGRLHFEVRDGGIGFNHARTGSGSGLINMRDRIEAVGGTLRIASGTRDGTSVCGSVRVQ